MNIRRIAMRAAVVVATGGATLSWIGAAHAASGGGGDAASYWTPARRQAAIPRDLVIDPRGLAYLHHPDGALTPYGHNTPRADQLTAAAAPQAKRGPGGGGGGGDTTGPSVTNLNPAANDTIGASYTFSADVSDASGIRSVAFVIVYPGGAKSQSFSPSLSSGSTTKYSLAISGFTDGQWSWYVKATDGARNTTTSPQVSFTVSTGSTPPPSSDVVTNAQWSGGGTVQTAAGRLYFQMPANSRLTKWQGYVCSGTTVTDGISGRSIILTAAHCVYDDTDKAFARNVLFIPDQSASGTPTDLDCTNDKFGCWSPSLGVVDKNYTTRVFPDNDKWDYAYYVASDTSHSGAGSGGELDGVVGAMNITFSPPDTTALGAALGYSYSDDPNFMYCQDHIATTNTVNWWLANCGLSGGSSGGPWLQPVDGTNGLIFSVNSWGYTTSPGMAGPMFNNSSAQCVFNTAKAQPLNGGNLAVTC